MTPEQYKQAVDGFLDRAEAERMRRIESLHSKSVYIFVFGVAILTIGCVAAFGVAGLGIMMGIVFLFIALLLAVEANFLALGKNLDDERETG